ncbi:DUF721 domain-containing protein [Orenia marismortui]|uniref:DUF721 domain-containing protein n=1 Tax=Orenia marismortui TaxID=46469 RepID=UPI00037ABE8B|nr:DUF721 domain-containing protein [Orenia marismortui]
MADLINEILNKTLNKLGISKKIEEKKILDLWSKITGNEIKKHTEAKYINQGILFITVDNPVWSHQLLFMKKDLINKINKELNKKLVKDIRFQSGKIKSKIIEEIEEDKKSYVNIELNNSDIREVEDTSNLITDPELKKKFSKLLETQKRIKKWKEINKWIPCPQCSVLISPEEEKCSICQVKENNIKLDMSKLEEVLINTPWLSYNEILNIFPNLLEEDLERIKNKLIKNMKNKLDRVITEAMKKEIDTNEAKVLIQNYVMLETGVHPERLNDRLIKKVIGDNYMKVYKCL